MEKAAEFLRKHAVSTMAAILFVVTLLVFLPGLSFDPVPLDNSAYVGREYLLYPSWQNILYHLKNPVLGLWSPLVMHSLMLDYWVWGKELLIAGGRLHNIILHGLNAVMFFILLCRIRFVRFRPAQPLQLSIAAAFFAALCFALHPQRVESVIWIVERKDVQALFCGLLSTLLFMHSFRKNRLPLAGALVYLLSFGAKPLIITLPGVLLLGIWMGTEKFNWKQALRMISPYIAAGLLYVIWNSAVLGSFASESARGVFNTDRIAIVAVNYANYFFRTLLPLDIRPLYPLFRWDSLTCLMVFAFWGGSAALAVLAFYKWRYRNMIQSLVLPLLLIFLGVLLPIVGFKSVGNAEFADRYSYYPCLVIWLSAAIIYEYHAPRRFIWQFAFWAYAALTAILGMCYLQSWQSSESFIHTAVGDGVHAHPAALRMAAWTCFENKDYDQALAFASQAVQNADDFRRKEDELFFLALEGMIAWGKGDPRGYSLIDQAISTPEWGRFRYSSRGFSENVLLKAAEINHAMYISSKNQSYMDKTIQIYMVLSDLSMGGDPAKDLSYEAYAAYLTGDYAKAEKLTVQALEYSPGDENLLRNLQTFRDLLKNPPAKEASNQ